MVCSNLFRPWPFPSSLQLNTVHIAGQAGPFQAVITLEYLLATNRYGSDHRPSNPGGFGTAVEDRLG